MGVLYDSVMEQKRKVLIQEIKATGVTVSQSGIELEKLSNEDLEYEWVLASFRSIDVAKDSNKFF